MNTSNKLCMSTMAVVFATSLFAAVSMGGVSQAARETPVANGPGRLLSQGENPAPSLAQGENPSPSLAQGENPSPSFAQGENPSESVA